MNEKGSKYLKPNPHKRRTDNVRKPKRGLFDLPDGTESIKSGNPVKPNPTSNKRSGGFYDLPSGAGKKEAIRKQQEFFKMRDLERRGVTKNYKEINDEQSSMSGGFSTSKSGSYFKPSKANPTPEENSQNLEKNVSKSSLNRYYFKEVGYYLKPIVAYLLATVIFVFLGALGTFNGVDLRIACTVIYGIFLFISGIFVNRYMSVPGFIILGVINVIGAIVGQTGIIENLDTFVSRLVKIANIFYFTFDTESAKLNSIIFVFSVIAPAFFIYLGSRLHKVTYFIRAKVKKQNITQEKLDLEQSMGDVFETKND